MRYSDLESTLIDDLAWRKSELSSLYSIAFSTKNRTEPSENFDDTLYKTVVKTLYLLLYSHWEGFIKKSCKIYLNYLNQQRIITNTLSNNFSALVLKKSINNCYTKENQDSLSIETYLNFVSLHYTKLSENFRVDVKIDNDFDDGFIKTFSNLNYKNYKNLIESLDLPFSNYFSDPVNKVEIIDTSGTTQNVEILKKHLDFSLLSYRHSIAHGGSISVDLDLSLENYETLQSIILFLMDKHSQHIQEYCYKELYLKTNSEIKQEYVNITNLEIKDFFVNLDRENLQPAEEYLSDPV